MIITFKDTFGLPVAVETSEVISIHAPTPDKLPAKAVVYLRDGTKLVLADELEDVITEVKRGNM